MADSRGSDPMMVTAFFLGSRHIVF